MNYLKFLVINCLLGTVWLTSSSAQQLKAGFDKEEYLTVLKLVAHQLDTPWKKNMMPMPAHYKLAYRSPTVGMDNRWDLFLRDDQKIAIISVRGTTAKSLSWLENFYSGMIPASGSLQLSDSLHFDYHFSDDPKAAVHIGWTIGLGFLAPGIVKEIKLQYERGVRNFIISGHSQGGAITYLLTSYLYNLRSEGILPKDINFKTYCSAAPKPGNLYYAYSFEQITAGGYGFNVVNPADWVPQTPISVQTLAGQPSVSPFNTAKKNIRKMKFPKNLALGFAYNQLNGGTKKAARRFEKYLGHYAGKQVKKALPGYRQPRFFHGADYVRAGSAITLSPDSIYYSQFPDTSSNVFIHHLLDPYLYLINKYPQ